MKKPFYLLIVAVMLLSSGLSACSLTGDLPVCDTSGINLQSLFPGYSYTVEELTSPMLEWRY